MNSKAFWYLAVAPDTEAFEIVNSSVELAKNTAASWNDIWTVVFDPSTAGLWTGLVTLGLTLAAGSIMFLAMTSGKDAMDKGSWSELVTMFVWPLVIALFLANSGNLLSKTVLLIRSFGYQQVQVVLETQLGSLSFKSAIQQVGISSIAKQRIEALYNECKTQSPEQMMQCWKSKEVQVQNIVNEAKTKTNEPLDGLQKFANMLTGIGNGGASAAGGALNFALDPGGVFRDALVPVIRAFLYALQWAFVNILEAALILTGLFAPIALGLSLLPFQGRLIWAWLTGFLSLFGIQIGYNIIVGLTATILVRSGAELASDLAFTCFLSIFAPGLATLIGRGGGLALYGAISNNVKIIPNLAGNLAMTTARSLVIKR